jgi:hypothetical protein
MAAISRRHGAEVSLLLGRRGEGGGRYVPREDTIACSQIAREPWSLVPLGQQRVAPFCTRHTPARRVDRGCSVRASIMELYC